MRDFWRIVVGLVVGVVISLTVSAAVAENDDGYTLDEVVVTAERRERNLQRVPLSITALTGDELDASAIENTFDLQYRTPGFEYKAVGVFGQPYIRGVGSDLPIIGPGADPAVATFVDGVYQARSLAALQDFYDVERIEILKGPQGTLFGRNATGGVLHIISKPPVPSFETQADLLYGNFDKRRVRGVVNVPLIKDKLFMRVAGLVGVRDGYTENIFLDQDLDDENHWAVRVQMLLFAADNVELLLGGDFTRERSSRALAPHPDPDCCLNLGILAGGTVPEDPREVTNNFENFQDTEAWTLRARITWSLGAVSLTSLTAYRDTRFAFDSDDDATEADAVFSASMEDTQTFTQEVQLASQTGGKFEWVAGFYYLWQEGIQELDGNIPLFAFRTQPRGDVDTQAWALFGQASYHLTEQWRVTAGIRYSAETKQYRFRQTLTDPFGMSTGVPGVSMIGGEDKKSWDAVTPKFGIEYVATHDLLLYASATRGFKAGGFNANQLQAAFDPEFIWAFEVGVKSSLLNHRLRLNLAGFYYDYDNLQLFTLSPNAPPGSFPVVINAAEATVKGIDIEIMAHPAEGFTTDLSMLFLDARFDEFVSIDPNNPDSDPNRSGGRLPQAPEFSAYIGMQYTRPFKHYGRVTVRGAYSYQSSVFFNPFQDPAVEQDGYGLVNARLQYDSADGHWYAALFGKNLTNALYAQNIIRLESLVGARRFWGAPRTYGIQLGYRF